jgi:hypothetical protein
VSVNESFPRLLDNPEEEVDMDHTMTEFDGEEMILEENPTNNRPALLQKQQSEVIGKIAKGE